MDAEARKARRDPEKEKLWRAAMQEHAGSGKPVREFCGEKGLNENQFYGWRRELKLIEGSIAMPPRKCGSATCACAQGVAQHRAMIPCKKGVNGRSVATYVPKDLWEQVRDWNREHKRIKKVLREMSAINEQIIRRHVRDQRRDQAVRRSLRVLPPP
jgi:transposase-like protein